MEPCGLVVRVLSVMIIDSYRQLSTAIDSYRPLLAREG